MPEMTLLGWFHTVLGVVALVTAFYTLFKYKMISLSNRSGKLYVLVTIVVAGSALGIYNQGGFGVAHWLAVLTLAAVSGGIIMEKLRLFGRFSIYFQALGYSSTLLFHMIPAITDFLRRLPLGDPFVDSFSDPLVVGFHKLFLLIFVVAMAVQLRWLSKRSSMDAVEAQD
ncbi:MAG: hypothetical protein NWS22_04125 [Porticoccaceae bacterium]|jgi:uncharacterized membrane protein|nr:MAG: hypothetical protein ABS23_11560 [SAR92 bacterium BACL16 MAG-120619-bin48]KRP21875.1 MAG: hypothetical protein ABS22_09715 [SAR92 bacterium BACL16 MAG-120322-bin99]MDO7636522.1 hypothetical protein [Porticoccaceae bacterium]MDP4654080.1 hypothetical protein [Alphaproteobacteria bacterium]MDP4744012.1 hypothetical protein [Porticoccaceae bacterium]